DRPHWAIVDPGKPRVRVEVREGRPRRELAPAHRPLAVEGEEPRGWPTPDQRAKRGTVLLRGPLVEISAPQPPVHAPAPVAGASLTEEVLQCRPQVGGEGADGEPTRLQGAFTLAMVPHVRPSWLLGGAPEYHPHGAEPPSPPASVRPPLNAGRASHEAGVERSGSSSLRGAGGGHGPR